MFCYIIKLVTPNSLYIYMNQRALHFYLLRTFVVAVDLYDDPPIDDQILKSSTLQKKIQHFIIQQNPKPYKQLLKFYV